MGLGTVARTDGPPESWLVHRCLYSSADTSSCTYHIDFDGVLRRFLTVAIRAEAIKSFKCCAIGFQTMSNLSFIHTVWRTHAECRAITIRAIENANMRVVLLVHWQMAHTHKNKLPNFMRTERTFAYASHVNHIGTSDAEWLIRRMQNAEIAAVVADVRLMVEHPPGWAGGWWHAFVWCHVFFFAQVRVQKAYFHTHTKSRAQKTRCKYVDESRRLPVVGERAAGTQSHRRQPQQHQQQPHQMLCV